MKMRRERATPWRSWDTVIDKKSATEWRAPGHELPYGALMAIENGP
jgi:hypothetical protein